MKTYVLLAVTAGLLLSGCDQIRNTFGLDHYQADEMRVDPNPPLTIPPNFKLRPPRPGEKNPNVEDASEKAQEVLTSDKPHKKAKKAKSGKLENAVLEKASENSPEASSSPDPSEEKSEEKTSENN